MNKGNIGLSRAIVAVSVVVPLAVAFLLFFPLKTGLEEEWVKFLPHLNGMMNSATVIILLMGFYFIRKKQVASHKASMISALILGSLFLVSYIIYHATMPSTPYGGDAPVKYVYYFFLLTHILLSIIVVPFVLFAFYYALSGNIPKHKKLVKYTLPIWLYVSATGVIVYLMISPYYA